MTWDWKHDAVFARFREAMAQSQVPEALLHAGDIPFLKPRTEGDIMSACNNQIIAPLHAIARCWATEWGLVDDHDHTNVIDLEVLHEGSCSVRAPELAIVDEVSSGRADIFVTESEAPQVPVLIGPTRFDQIFAFSHEITREHLRLSSHRGLQHTQWLEGTSTFDRVELSREAGSSTLSSLHRYLKPSQYFNINTGFELQDAIIKGDTSFFKGLVAVGFQKNGYMEIVSQEVQQIAVDQEPLSGGSGRHEGTMTLLQQAVQSGYHYGVECVCVTDYLNVLVLKLPKHAGGEVSNDEEHETFFVDWAVVEREEAKLLLAFLLWKGMNDLRGLLDEANQFRVVNVAATRPQMVSGPI